MEVQVFSAAPIKMEEIIIKKDDDNSNKSIRLVTDYLENYKYDKILSFLRDFHNADIAEILQNLDPVLRLSLLNIMDKNFDPEILTYLNDSLREEIIQTLDIKQLANNAKSLDIDDAVDLAEDLEEKNQNIFLENLDKEERTLVKEGLNYPEDSAGRLMQRQFVAIDQSWNVGQAIDYLRNNKGNLPEDFYDIYLINQNKEVKGIAPLGRLMGSKREIELNSIMNKELRLIDVNTDQEDVALLFNKYGLVSAPVINNQKKIIGSITVDDVVEVIEEEREEDILKLGGVDHTDLYESVISTTKSRISWLIVNLMTAVVASIVIGLFEAAIEKVVALAILMPIVASMGANAGTQTLTVAVRAIAVKELTTSNAIKIIIKETLIGGINGIIFAIIISLISIYWFESLMLGLIIGLAMILNLLIAGFSGIAIPLVLDKLKIDPALASAVILTTITDVFGFLSFLGLATLFLI
ncbi:magnesium transporter [Pelagibacteraceae bacterium]|nr:magnesium transporter [Pelagibacteraceae bacterium]